MPPLRYTNLAAEAGALRSQHVLVSTLPAGSGGSEGSEGSVGLGSSANGPNRPELRPSEPSELLEPMEPNSDVIPKCELPRVRLQVRLVLQIANVMSPDVMP